MYGLGGEGGVAGGPPKPHISSGGRGVLREGPLSRCMAWGGGGVVGGLPKLIHGLGGLRRHDSLGSRLTGPDCSRCIIYMV